MDPNSCPLVPNLNWFIEEWLWDRMVACEWPPDRQTGTDLGDLLWAWFQSLKEVRYEPKWSPTNRMVRWEFGQIIRSEDRVSLKKATEAYHERLKQFLMARVMAGMAQMSQMQVKPEVLKIAPAWLDLFPRRTNKADREDLFLGLEIRLSSRARVESSDIFDKVVELPELNISNPPARDRAKELMERAS